tara:strand:- start:262 stop:612 length:351 start_codon:yes stop_codon:yes gene_type:complete
MNESRFIFTKNKKIWTLLFAAMITVSVFLYGVLVEAGIRTGYWFFFDVIFALGGAPFVLIAPNVPTGYLLGTLYIVGMSYLFLSGIKSSSVTVLKIAIFLAIYTLGIGFSIFYSTG